MYAKESRNYWARLIGGSIGLALCEEGWEVIGRDIDPSRIIDAKTMGAITDEGSMGDCEIVFVATPVSGIAESVHQAFEEGAKAVTDVGSVKGSLVSQQVTSDSYLDILWREANKKASEGLALIFRGAAWVLTPQG